jgi:hypothetical protein
MNNTMKGNTKLCETTVSTTTLMACYSMTYFNVLQEKQVKAKRHIV